MSAKIESSIRSAYSGLKESYLPVQSEVCELLEEACRLRKWIFDGRSKSVESYASKLMTGRNDGYDVDDFYACTIVVPNLKGVPEAMELVRNSFEICEERPGREIRMRPTEFNFDSIRLYCHLKPSVKPQKFQQLKFEVQVKTLLEYAWAKATHDFSYKGAEVSWAKERLSAQMKAILDNVDLSIFEMENISSSEFLNKINPEYERLKSIVGLLKEEFASEGEVQFAEDCKRLSENISRVLKRTNISVEELRQGLRSETDQGRGAQMVNLSVYSIVLISLINRYSSRIKRALEKSAPGRNPQNFVIPYEVAQDWGVDTSKFQQVIVLTRYEDG